jgi:hypothetical protein
MDVILDSNIFLADIRFEKSGFEGLFDYLKRTGHHLIIPEVVFQEVLARHKDKLSEWFEKAKSNCANLRQWQVSGDLRLPPIDIEAESKALFLRLNQPTPWVRAIRYGKNSEITAMDVALRGIHRVKPASATGEQLRDVLLWLLVLRYAQETKRGIAFISRNNKDFCNPEKMSCIQTCWRNATNWE